MPRVNTLNIIPATLFFVVCAGVYCLCVGAVVAASNGTLETEQKKEFAKCWEFRTSPDLSIQSESDASTIYFVDVERRLIAVDLSSGAVIWSTDLGGAVVSNLLVTGDSLIVVTTSAETGTSGDASMRSISKQTGITNWFVKIPNSPDYAIGAVNGTVVAIAQGGLMWAFAIQNGDAKWNKSIGANVTTPAHFGSSAAYVGTDLKDVVAVAASSGDATPAAKSEGVPAVVLSDSDGRILAGDDRGNVVLTSANGKRLWRFRNGARITALSLYDSEFLAASNDNFVYKLSRGGNVEWKRRLSSRIEGHPVVLGDAAVFATVGDGNVFVLDLTNGKILNRLENGENNSAQAVRAGSSFAMVTEDAIGLYSRESCTANKKAVPQ